MNRSVQLFVFDPALAFLALAFAIGVAFAFMVLFSIEWAVSQGD